MKNPIPANNRRGPKGVVSKTDANPEGKGANGLLADWRATEPRGVVAKPPRQVLAELFTSMLVLTAAFKFRPAPGQVYYLYWTNGEWSLSLIAPHEWSAERLDGYAGACTLQRDMTWTIAPSERLGEDSAVAAAMRRFFRAFAAMLDTDLTLEEILPFYVGRLPYQQRLHASALSRSLRATIALGEQVSAGCREWRRQLPLQSSELLAGPSVTSGS